MIKHNSNSIIYYFLYPYTGQRSKILLLRYILFTPGFKCIFLFRKTSTENSVLSTIFWKLFLIQCRLRTGIQIPESTKIGVGFRIIHFGYIVIHPEIIVGRNFNISQGVTLGHAEGVKVASPKIGDNVSIGPNAVVAGGI